MHLSTLTLNQLRYGELDEPAERRARAHLDDCNLCSDRLNAQVANRRAFVLEPVPEALRAPPSAGWWRRPALWLTPALALAAALLILPRLLEPAVDSVPSPVQDPTERAKGAGILLEAWLETDEGPRLLGDNAFISAGDMIQLRYDAEDFAFVSFGGVDGSGNPETYGSFSTEQGIQTAPFALNIDRTPGEQQFFALFTESRPSQDQVVEAIRTRTPPQGGILRSLHLRKPR